MSFYHMSRHTNAQSDEIPKLLRYFSLHQSQPKQFFPKQGIQKVYKRYTKGIQKVYKRYTEGIQKVYKRYTKGMQKVYKRHTKVHEYSQCVEHLSQTHRYLSNIDCLMSHTACLVCFISTVNGHSKKKRKKATNVALVAGT